MSITAIQDSAAKLGGTCTRRFSQSTDPVAKIIAMHPSTAGGICMMLSASWAGNLMAGKSLWDMMYFGGHFQAGTIVTLMHNFIDDEVQNLDWQYVRRMYFEQHAARHVRSGKARGNAKKGSASLGKDLAAAIQDARSAGNAVTLDISGPGGAHAVAAWTPTTGSDHFFFDPNYGEFSFPNANALSSFLEQMVTLSDYKNDFGAVRSEVWRRA